MTVEHLKYVRVGLSLLFLAVTAFLFLDLMNSIPPALAGGITFLQFVPSLLRFMALGGASAFGFLVVAVLTLLLGRVYCSSICPLGTIQDIITYIARKRNRRRWFGRRKENRPLRYGILGLTAGAFVAGSGALVALLDPFSNAGRLVTALVRPAVVGANNALATGLDLLRLYALDRIPLGGITLVSVLWALLVTGVVGWLSYTHGRLYCNTVCPVGSFLGLLARSSFVRIVIRKEECIGCGLCERVCKAECIDKSSKSVDNSRCIACFNCFHACPTDGMKFRVGWARSVREPTVRTDRGRRAVLQASWLLLAGLNATVRAQKKVVVTKETTIPVTRAHPVVPPGARSTAHFTARCTACHLCVSACPSRVLAPSTFEYGISGFLQPTMDYASGYCNFDCIRCSQVCPSGAILPLVQEEKKLTQLGTARFVKENCVVYTENTDCGACSEHCPTKAVTMVPYKGALVIPEVHAEYCVGCGACEHACPTRPYRAIMVDGNPVHKPAKKPESKKLEDTGNATGDFPF